MNFTCYKISTGQILWQGDVPDYMFELQHRPQDDIGAAEGSWAEEDYYFVDDEPAIRQPLPVTTNVNTIVANGAAEYIIQNIPTGTSVEWPDGEAFVINDGEVIFSVDTPGQYRFKLSCFPYKSQELICEAVANP